MGFKLRHHLIILLELQLAVKIYHLVDVVAVVGDLALGTGICIIVVELVDLVLVDGLVLLPDHLHLSLLVLGNGQCTIL
jgi:hypothetical protein